MTGGTADVQVATQNLVEEQLRAEPNLAGIRLAAVAVAMSPMMSSDFAHAEGMAKPNKFWWPDQVDLSPLRDHGATSNPLGENFNYAEAFAALDLDAVKQDIVDVMTTSQDWWPAD